MYSKGEQTGLTEAEKEMTRLVDQDTGYKAWECYKRAGARAAPGQQKAHGRGCCWSLAGQACLQHLVLSPSVYDPAHNPAAIMWLYNMPLQAVD